MYEIYPGIKGRTQGERKLINPAKKATVSVIFIINYIIYYLDHIGYCIYKPH